VEARRKAGWSRSPSAWPLAQEMLAEALAALAGFGGRLLVREPVREPSFRQWVSVEHVEG
jgi:hypothetical protein